MNRETLKGNCKVVLRKIKQQWCSMDIETMQQMFEDREREYLMRFRLNHKNIAKDNYF